MLQVSIHVFQLFAYRSTFSCTACPPYICTAPYKRTTVWEQQALLNASSRHILSCDYKVSVLVQQFILDVPLRACTQHGMPMSCPRAPLSGIQCAMTREEETREEDSKSASISTPTKTSSQQQWSCQSPLHRHSTMPTTGRLPETQSDYHNLCKVDP